MASHVLSDIFDKITSADKDFRFMATSDLLHELQREMVRMDSDTEQRLCGIVLQRMQDSAGEISEMAVKCLAVLVPKIQERHLIEIARTLTKNFLSERKESNELQEVANVGLKTMIESVNSHTSIASALIRELTPHLVKGMKADSDETVLMSLEVARDFVLKYGSGLDSQGDVLLKMFLDLLSESRPAIRKKATACIGVLSISLSEARLQELLKLLLTVLSSTSTKTSILASHVQTIGVVAHAVGDRIGDTAARAILSVSQLIDVPTIEDVELIESSIRALESFVSRSGIAVRSHLDAIIDLCIRFLNFDPNYVGDDGASEGGMGSDDEDDMYSDEEAFSDDDEESWKVRKASASCLNAVFLHNADIIQQIYQKVAPVLVGRFNEREENVKLDVLISYITLLHQIRFSLKGFSRADIHKVLAPSIPQLLKMIGKQLNDKSSKTRLQAFRVLREATIVMPTEIAQNIEKFVQPIFPALKGTSGSSDLKLEVLAFLGDAMNNSSPSDFQPILPQIAPVVFESVEERYYKITSAALHVCDEIVRVIRPTVDTIVDDSLSPLIPLLYKAVMPRFKAQDVDQEVKEYAIRCMANVVAGLGDLLPTGLDEIMQIMLERLGRQTTQLTAAKALAVIGSSSLDLHFANAAAILRELTIFLKKANVTLRQAALRALNVFCLRKDVKLDKDIVDRIVLESSVFVTDHDMHFAANSLDLLSTVARAVPQSKAQIRELIVPKALALVESPLLQGGALESVQSFFVSMADQYKQLFDNMMKEIPGKVQQQSTSKCIAAMCCRGNISMLPFTLTTLLNCAAEGQPEAIRRLALLTLGEIGRLTSLGKYPGVEQLLMQSLEDVSEDVKSSASHAVGALTLGNITELLPKLVENIHASRGQPRQLYLLLLSLNDVITGLNLSKAHTPLAIDHVVAIRDMLLSSHELEDDCRNVASECIGQLALLHPDLMLPSLKRHLHSDFDNIRYLIVAGIRYTIIDQPHAVDEDLKESLPLYLERLTDESRHVRKASVQLMTSILTHKAYLIQDRLADALANLYEQAEKREDLVRVLDFGPFKHRIDDGIELRKATFECMNLLLEKGLSHLDVTLFILHLCKGLADVDDIKLLCYPMIIKLCTMAHDFISTSADKITEPLYKTLTKNITPDAIKHERERRQELIRSCLRAVDAMDRVETIYSQKGFKRMMDSVVNKGDMRTMFQNIQKERTQAEEEKKTTTDSAMNRSISGSMGYD